MAKNKVAVSYRIPLMVTAIVILPDGNAYPLCPHCNSSLDREYQRYCDRCGQALSWKKYSQAIISYV
ncbi:MAG: hypothetical protein IJN42_03840 [Clostridia bacterium]|nr:hypothetical protein [Clostridia bacterium]